MDHLPEVLDLSIVFTNPPPNSPPEILASVALQCDALGLDYTGNLFTDPLTEAERDDLGWYLEEYWRWPYLEFAKRGKQVEALLSEVGRRLYHAVFGSSKAENIVQVWQQHVNVQHHQMSIVSGIPSVFRLPWELLSDPHGFLVLDADHPISIVRRLLVHEQATLATPIQLPLRVLLVTARPEGIGFTDPRSISRELVDELQMQSEVGNIELEFLRPPTLKALCARLQDTMQPPIHVLHFDGHGGLGGEKQQGMLLFETEVGNGSLVEASSLAKVLQNSGVRLAVLTACQSAVDTRDDAFSSVSTALIGNGVDAVIAMSSSILETSAARYAEAFYHALAAGLPVSIAHEQARQALQKDPRRHLLRRRQDGEAAPVKLQDWWVPHFYQQRPLTLQTTTTMPRKRVLRQTSTPPHFNDTMPPEPRYRFSGRARELHQIERHLLREELVVLSGFGGIGKTALVREAADWLTRTGMYTAACFISFEHGGDVFKLLSTLGTFLGVYDGTYTPNNPKTALECLTPALAARPTLVIADNLESILPGGKAPLSEEEKRTPLWNALLALAKLHAGVLLTSRDPNIGDGLLAPGHQVAALPLRGLSADDAYELATRLLTDLDIDLDRAQASYAGLRDLLSQLDHHPLAIQLVLPALHTTPLPYLRTNFAILLHKFKDDQEGGRNRSLLASLDYSLHYLSEEQRALLPRLTLFEGGANEDILLEITDIPKQDWLPLRQSLQQAALLVPENISFLRFHPVLIPYLRNPRRQLGADDTALRTRYKQRYSALARALHYEDRHHPQTVRALAQKELPNLRHALALLLEDGELNQAVEVESSIIHFLNVFGFIGERDEPRQQVNAAVTQQHVDQHTQLTRAEWLREAGLGEDEWRKRSLHAASMRFAKLLARIEAQPEGTPLGRGSYEHSVALLFLARCFGKARQYSMAERLLRQALLIIDALLKPQPENTFRLGQRASLLSELGATFLEQHDYAQAQTIVEEALRVYTQINAPREVAGTLYQLGQLAYMQRAYTRARKHYTESLKRFRKLGEPEMESELCQKLGILAARQGNWNEAERCYRESLTIREQLGLWRQAADTCHMLGVTAQGDGRSDEAEGWYRQALELNEHAHPTNADAQTADILSDLAALLMFGVRAGRTDKTRLQEARCYAEQALEIRKRLDTPKAIEDTLDILAQIADMEEGQKKETRVFRRSEREADKEGIVGSLQRSMGNVWRHFSKR